MMHPNRLTQATGRSASLREHTNPGCDSVNPARRPQAFGVLCRGAVLATVLLPMLQNSPDVAAQSLTPRSIPVEVQIDVGFITSQYYGNGTQVLNDVTDKVVDALNEYWELPWEFEPHPVGGDRMRPRLIVHLTEQQGDWYLELRTVDQLNNESNPGSMLKKPVYLATGTEDKPSLDDLPEFCKTHLKNDIIGQLYRGARDLREEFRFMPFASGKVLHQSAQPVGGYEGAVLVLFAPPYENFSRSVFIMVTEPNGASQPQVELVCEGTGGPVNLPGIGPGVAPQPILRVRHMQQFPDPLPAPYQQLRQDVDVYFWEYKPPLGLMAGAAH